MSILDKVDQTTLREELPKLHSNYYGASESQAEFEFLKVRFILYEYIKCSNTLNLKLTAIWIL